MNELEEFPPEMDEVVLAQIERDKMILAREKRDRLLETMTVTNNAIEYDANMSAQSNMGDAGTLANWLFNKSITESLMKASSAPDATNELKYIAGLFAKVYQGVYKDNKINWKGADDKIHQVQGESILEALMQTMTKKGSIIEKGADG